MDDYDKKSAREVYEITFYGLKRTLAVSFLSPKLKIANFSIVGDIEFTEKACDEMEKKLKEKNIIPDCFVAPALRNTPFVYEMAKRFHHNRYIILRKSIRGYMINPMIELPWRTAPKHVKKLVLCRSDREYLKGKNIVLIDEVISTGATIEMLNRLMEKIDAKVLAKCAIFKQGNRYKREFICLSELPLLIE